MFWIRLSLYSDWHGVWAVFIIIIFIIVIVSVVVMVIARPKGVPPKAARPKDGLFRLHASWIYLSYAGFDCLAAILCH